MSTEGLRAGIQLILAGDPGSTHEDVMADAGCPVCEATIREHTHAIIERLRDEVESQPQPSSEDGWEPECLECMDTGVTHVWSGSGRKWVVDNECYSCGRPSPVQPSTEEPVRIEGWAVYDSVNDRCMSFYQGERPASDGIRGRKRAVLTIYAHPSTGEDHG